MQDTCGRVHDRLKDIVENNTGSESLQFASMVLRVSILVFQTRGSASKADIRSIFTQEGELVLFSPTSLCNAKSIPSKGIITIGNNMNKNIEEKRAELVDPLDAEAAISDFISVLRNRGMSTSDLALELGWSRNKVDKFFYGVDTPKKSEFVQVAEVLEVTLDFSE